MLGVLPDRPEAITAEWLTGALGSSLPDVEVTRVEILDQHSGTTGRARLLLEYARGSSGPETVFVKLPPFDESQRNILAFTDMGRREAGFYARLAAETPLRVPGSYFAAYGDGPMDYIMVLEDLEAAGCSFLTRLEPHADDHAEQLIDSLGRLHAHFWEDARFDEELSWVKPAMRHELGATLVDHAREQFGRDFPPVFTELCRLYSENYEAVSDLWDVGEQTLIHGDTHAGNQFVENGRVGLYDWAVISRSPGIRDVSIYLGNSCPTDLRRREQERLLRTYHQVLADAGVDVPDVDVLWERYRLGVLYAWVAATTTAAMGSAWQPIEVGMLGMTRATETCADLETVEAFREAL